MNFESLSFKPGVMHTVCKPPSYNGNLIGSKVDKWLNRSLCRQKIKHCNQA